MTIDLTKKLAQIQDIVYWGDCPAATAPKHSTIQGESSYLCFISYSHFVAHAILLSS